MRLEVIDFPSDTNCELPVRLREKLAAAVQRACESRSACEKFEEVVRFTAQKLKEAKKELQAYEDKCKPVKPESVEEAE